MREIFEIQTSKLPTHMTWAKIQTMSGPHLVKTLKHMGRTNVSLLGKTQKQIWLKPNRNK